MPSNVPIEGKSIQPKVFVAPYWRLFMDAIFFSSLAESAPVNSPTRCSLARASILNSAFCVEGVVNILFNNTHLSKGLLSSLDRLSTLQKYELILSYRHPSQKFDKGKKEIQAVDELLSIRDKNVHAKILTYDMREKALLDYEVDHIGQANILKIPLDSAYWTYEHSEIVINATDDFFWYYFFELCHMKNNYVAELLADIAILPNGKKAIIFADSHSAMFNMVRSHKRLDLKFLCEMAKIHNL